MFKQRELYQSSNNQQQTSAPDLPVPYPGFANHQISGTKNHQGKIQYSHNVIAGLTRNTLFRTVYVPVFQEFQTHAAEPDQKHNQQQQKTINNFLFCILRFTGIVYAKTGTDHGSAHRQHGQNSGTGQCFSPKNGRIKDHLNKCQRNLTPYRRKRAHLQCSSHQTYSGILRKPHYRTDQRCKPADLFAMEHTKYPEVQGAGNR